MDDVVVSFSNDARRSNQEATYRCEAPVDNVAEPMRKTGKKGELCLHCLRPLHKRRVYPCAHSYDRYNGKLKMGPGLFCEPECSLGFLTDSRASAESLSFTRWMFLELYGFPSSRVHAALPRWSNKKFGGPLDLSVKEDVEIFMRSPTEEHEVDVEAFESVKGIPYAIVLEVKMARNCQTKTDDEALALSGKAEDLERPKNRGKASVAQCRPTGGEPIILNKFARMLEARAPDKAVRARQEQEEPEEAAREQKQGNEEEDSGLANEGASKRRRNPSARARVRRRR